MAEKRKRDNGYMHNKRPKCLSSMWPSVACTAEKVDVQPRLQFFANVLFYGLTTFYFQAERVYHNNLL